MKSPPTKTTEGQVAGQRINSQVPHGWFGAGAFRENGACRLDLRSTGLQNSTGEAEIWKDAHAEI